MIAISEQTNLPQSNTNSLYALAYKIVKAGRDLVWEIKTLFYTINDPRHEKDVL